jgi:hypothetical protein
MAGADEPTDADKTPVTIVTGFLGAGKTTLVNYILQGDHGKKIAVIENEFGEVNIDEALVSENLQYKEDVISMDNGCARCARGARGTACGPGCTGGGVARSAARRRARQRLRNPNAGPASGRHRSCVCCTVRGDLIKALTSLMKRGKKFDHVLIETTGLADPAPVAFVSALFPAAACEARRARRGCARATLLLDASAASWRCCARHSRARRAAAPRPLSLLAGGVVAARRGASGAHRPRTRTAQPQLTLGALHAPDARRAAAAPPPDLLHQPGGGRLLPHRLHPVPRGCQAHQGAPGRASHSAHAAPQPRGCGFAAAAYRAARARAARARAGCGRHGATRARAER